jgi:FKBP-type peptidyl-prolyl cis-trans isomerase 2
MSLTEGDVVRFDYTLWNGKGDALDTSIEETAKELKIHNDKKAYRPLTITVGRRQIIPGLENELLGMEVGKSATFDIPAADAYGVRDASKIKDIPMAQFRKEKVQPQLGMTLNYENQRAIVTRVAGGRVRIDMNHDLAGQDLRYEINMTEQITDRNGKVAAVLDGLFMGGAPFTLTEDTLEMEVPQQALFDQSWAQAKFRVVNELKMAAGEPLVVKLVESYPAMPQMPAPGEDDAAGEEE